MKRKSGYLITDTVAKRTKEHKNSGNDMIIAMPSPVDQCPILGFDSQSLQSHLHSDWKKWDMMVDDVQPFNVAEGMDFDEIASCRMWGRCANNVIFQ